MAVLGLRFCARAFSSCGKWGHSSSQCAGLSLSWPLLLRSTGSRRAGSVIVAHGPSCSAARGIFPDQGSNPCPLHWQADSQPLRHQGSPLPLIFKFPLSFTLYGFYVIFQLVSYKSGLQAINYTFILLDNKLKGFNSTCYLILDSSRLDPDRR